MGPSRGLTTHDVPPRELVLLEGAPRSFVEFENEVGDNRIRGDQDMHVEALATAVENAEITSY
ncbi:hypothetical protein ACFWBN_14630 [Streptomyces sp. NPDC059989]|uniref:hypothetical protein n=1 Tax=Streptomyces sp. NPDC059989 TaxID=3347026 RepID=UPI00367D9835